MTTASIAAAYNNFRLPRHERLRGGGGGEGREGGGDAEDADDADDADNTAAGKDMEEVESLEVFLAANLAATFLSNCILLAPDDEDDDAV